MADDQYNPVVVLRTAQAWQFEMAVDALKRAGIPHMAEEETLTGLRLAMPLTAVSGPGVFWSLQIPSAQVDKAQQVLSELPFGTTTDIPGAWDFQPSPGVKKIWKLLIVVVLALLLTVWLVCLLM